MKALKDMTVSEMKEYFLWLSREVEALLPPGPSRRGKSLFALLVIDDAGASQYASNATREVTVKAFRDTAHRIDESLTTLGTGIPPEPRPYNPGPQPSTPSGPQGWHHRTGG